MFVCPQAVGKPHTLWVAFAKFYERHGDIANARVIFDKATQEELKYMDDLATVWCEWAEMELRHKNFKRALSLMRQATQPPATLGTRQVRNVPLLVLPLTHPRVLLLLPHVLWISWLRCRICFSILEPMLLHLITPAALWQRMLLT